MATTADEATLTAALLPPVDSTATKKKKKKSKKKSIAKTTVTDSILQQQLDATATIGSDAAPTPLFTFSQAVKELNGAQEAGEDPKEALTRFWRHAYRLGEEDGRFEASREMEQTGYQQGYDSAISKLIAAGHQLEGECRAGRVAREDAGVSASMQEDVEAVEEAFRRGKELGLDEGQKTGYYDGLTEGRLELEETTLEVFAEACSAGRKEGATKEKEAWIGLGHTESGVCQAGRKDFVDVAIAVGAPTHCFTDAGIVTDSQIHSGPTRPGRRDLVDVAIAVGPPTRHFTDAAVTTDLPVHLEPVSSPKPAPFSWADDVESIPIHFVQSTFSLPGPRDISCLSSGTQKPFASLQHRLKRNSIRQRRSTGHNRSRYQVPVQQHFTRQSSRSSAPLRHANTFTTQASSLDWTGDPRLFRLRDALEDLGWLRR